MSHSLGGNCLTSIICHVSAHKDHMDQSLVTLRFANIAKKIKLHAIQNEVSSGFEHINEDMERLSKIHTEWFEKHPKSEKKESTPNSSSGLKRKNSLSNSKLKVESDELAE